MISIKNPKQIEAMRKAGALLYEVYQELRKQIKPGVSTAELDAFAEQLIRKNHAIPSCLGYNGFPATLCTSVDDQVVHGIPSSKQILQEGQIITIDSVLELDGWMADSAFTVGVGEISDEAQHLIDVTEQCFWQGIRQAVAGNRVGDISRAVQTYAESHGCGVVRDLTGHGIGREMHEDPTVWNFVSPQRGVRLRPGMTICVEPMITAGNYRVDLQDDDWCFRTHDHSLAAHYEHTILITEDGLPELLTYPGFTWGEGK